ncbi:formate--tetrahydrofolate ligase 1 [Lapidilactobacillus dextrinicus DSM 20335]|uniref:Formate--tetrahydrofolate ligase n=1 Tax=Lapidilactobacillus dextrinicus DSM 20335 TaxID=1423738 RepID=A0A0R2BU38_9LACO|nr:formate--tetrahydrofolate ligase [Lapidilactobacillus dextrinicus]KRM79244.1 formate--tetrahydrofolate ligase 1 [Lapidilactobacillus dextrinicus DSM 20335]QFG46914.1 formate--tetrahydrofolate ligase [Lapidilactobacillus dextrinicus]
MEDIEIAQKNVLEPIEKIATKIGLTAAEIEPYGHDKAKLPLEALAKLNQNPAGKLVLVTSINPTPAGEGKSTVLVGLADALRQRQQRAVIALREPSLGPVMGMKGGATGGGYAQVVPMADINLHFTGDMHALTATVNTLAALIDNHIHQGNALNIDPKRIIWKRALDINDRALREIVIGLGKPANGEMRSDGFDITVASEMMAVLCLATSLTDLKKRISEILIGYTYDREPIYVKDLKVEGALTVLLKDAIKPNLVQTLEHTPAIIHGGPFANIAHGCNSILATEAAIHAGDYAITEAGFGADLGAEKFLDIVTPKLSKAPDVIVVVATIRALKYNGGQALADLKDESVSALEHGYENLHRHLQNMQRYGIPVVVSINHFASDTDQELAVLQDLISQEGLASAITDVHEKGGRGGLALADLVMAAAEDETPDYERLYADDETVTIKIRTIAQKIYGAADIELTSQAKQQLRQINKHGWNNLPICIAKTQYSFSDQPKLLGAPTGFTLTIRELIPKLGAGFIVAMAGSVLTMPGLPKHPAAEKIDIDADGKISGLF